MGQSHNTNNNDPTALRQSAAEYDNEGRKLKLEVEFKRQNRSFVDVLSFLSGAGAVAAYETLERPTAAIALGVVAVGGVIASRFQKSANAKRYTELESIAWDTVAIHDQAGLTPPRWATSVLSPDTGRPLPPMPTTVPDYLPDNIIDLRTQPLDSMPRPEPHMHGSDS